MEKIYRRNDLCVSRNNEKKMKTIFISSFHVLISRNILSAPFFDLLCKQKGLRIVLLVPEHKKDFFQKEFARENIVVEGIKRRALRRDAYLNDLGLAALRTMSTRIRGQKRIGWIFWYTRFLFFWAPLIRSWYQFIYKFFIPRDTFSEVLDRYKPDLVFATDVLSSLDPRLMLETKARNIPLVGMVRSWDNLTTKGLLPVIPDILVVNNTLLEGEAVRYHHISQNQIRVVGIPHYDRYVERRPVNSREQFYRSIGADLSKRLVLLAPLGDRFFDRNTFDRDTIEIVSGMIPESHQLLVRLPPADSVSLGGYIQNENVIFDRPGVHFANDPNFKKSEMQMRDDDHLIDSLYYCDVVVAVSTTLTIDAAVFDKPLIIMGFDSTDRKITKGSAARLLEYNHAQYLLKSPGIKVAYSPEELQNALIRYLDDSSKDREGRKKLVSDQCYKVDGNSSQRLLAVLQEYL